MNYTTHTVANFFVCLLSDPSLMSMFEATEDTSDRMDTIMDEVQRQNLALKQLLNALLPAAGVLPAARYQFSGLLLSHVWNNHLNRCLLLLVFTHPRSPGMHIAIDI